MFWNRSCAIADISAACRVCVCVCVTVCVCVWKRDKYVRTPPATNSIGTCVVCVCVCVCVWQYSGTKSCSMVGISRPNKVCVCGPRARARVCV